jgi:hypothetical protein
MGRRHKNRNKNKSNTSTTSSTTTTTTTVTTIPTNTTGKLAKTIDSTKNLGSKSKEPSQSVSNGKKSIQKPTQSPKVVGQKMMPTSIDSDSDIDTYTK